MKVTTKAVYQMHDDGSLELLEEQSHEYEGPVAKCFGGDSDTSSETTNVVETNQSAIETIESGALGISSLGDVDLEIQTTDLGAVQGAFDFTQNFADSAFDFANDAQSQAADISEGALETSQRALATVATGGQSDLAGINSRTIIFVVAGLAAIVLLPVLLRRK